MESYEIKLASGRFTPEASTVSAKPSMAQTQQDNRYYLVQFYDLSEDDYVRLLDQGIEIIGYIPDSTYVIKDENNALDQGSYEIRWKGALKAEQKIEPALKEILESPLNGKINITIVLFEVPDDPEIELIGNHGTIINSKSAGNYIVVETAKDEVSSIADLDFIQLLYQYEPARLFLDRSSKVISADYVWGQGNDASGVTVGIIDSGIERDNPHFAGPDGLYGTADDNTIIYYAHDYAGNDTEPEAECGDIDPGGTPQCNDGFNNDGDVRADGEPNIDEGIHGILVAGVISGSGTYDTRAITGISGNANLVISRTFDMDEVQVVPGPDSRPWENILDLDEDGDYNEPSSADVISISWGELNGVYTGTSVRADEVVNGVLVDGNKRVLVVVSAGNNGEDKKVGAPGTGKNVLTVGASSSFRVLGSSCYDDICYDPNNLMVMNFSCRGTNDGRVKPDILAPGAFVTTSSIDDDYKMVSGTSFSAPHASAVAAQILHNYPSATPELIKSMIIASAAGGGTTDNPNMDQGWGRLNAYSAVYQTQDEYYDQYHADIVGNSKSGYPVKGGYSFYVPENADKLIVTMVYWDDAAIPIGAVLNNDLDLYLEAPSGSTELPNGHETKSDDNINNVEKYVIENPQSGDWNAWVEGLWFNDAYGLWAKSIDYAINIRIIKQTKQPDIDIQTQAYSYHADMNVPFNIYADVTADGLSERDVYAQAVETYSEVFITSPDIPITDKRIDVLGDIPADSSRRTRDFELVATAPGRYDIAINAYGRDEMDAFQADADMVTIIVCDQDEDGYYDNNCGGDDCDDDDANINLGQPELCDNGIDDDCDGVVDAADPDCSGACSCTGWSNQGCGQSPCAAGKMKQARSCTPGGCDTEQRCVSHESCGGCDSSSYASCPSAYEMEVSNNADVIQNLCGGRQYFKVTTTETCSIQWQLKRFGTTADYDIYTKWDGSCPSAASHDCNDWTNGGNTAVCEEQDLPPGTYYAMADRYFGSGGTYSIFVQLDCPVQCIPEPEICDGLDNDCDGVIDEVYCTVPQDGMSITSDTTFCAGTYSLPNGISIDSGVTLDCNGAELVGGGLPQGLIGIDIKASGVTVIGCTIRDYYHGIWQDGYSGNVFEGNQIVDNSVGASFKMSDGNIISGNMFLSNADGGVYLTESSHNNVVNGNNISGNGFLGGWKGDGGLIIGSENNTAVNNSIESNRFGVYMKLAYYNIIRNNTLLLNEMGVRIELADQNKISGNSINHNELGIYMVGENNNVSGNNISSNGIGVNVYGEGNSIEGNQFVGNGNGVSISLCAGNVVRDNRIEGNTRSGVKLDRSNNTNVTNNTFLANWNAVFLDSGNRNIIVNNNVTNSSNYGILVWLPSDNNSIWENNIIGNSLQAFDDGGNEWDNGIYGNHWSDYDQAGEGCLDTDSNGVCDSPKPIDGNSNQDNYPLVKAGGWICDLTGDTNGDRVVNIFDLAAVGLCYGQPATGGCESADVTGDGVVNIFDLATVGLEYGRTC